MKVARVEDRNEDDARWGKGAGAVGGGACELCRRPVHELTRHHLIPRSRHNNKRVRKAFGRREMEERIVLLCRPCHRNVHVSIDNKDLEREYNTIEALAAHPGVERFTRWVWNKPHGALAPGPTGNRKTIYETGHEESFQRAT